MTALPCPFCGRTPKENLVTFAGGERLWAVFCGGHSYTTPPEDGLPSCHGDINAPMADDLERVRAAWNAAVLVERARIDKLVGFVSPLDYAWANRRRKRHA